MSFFARMMPSGGSPKDDRQTRQEAVDKLCNALLHAALLEDRRAAAKALKSVAKHYQLEIGSLGMPSLIAALKRDAEDVETCRSILETFIAICTATASEEGEAEEEDGLHLEFCEILLKDRGVIETMLNCLEEQNQYVRYSVLQLLSVLEEYLPAQLPAAILASPAGLARLLDLLDDGRDIVRNEVILLLQRLTESSPEIQKIAVFEGTFERLFELIAAEGGVFGGEVLVEDAFVIIHNLLRHNPSNQNYFCESPCLSKLPAAFLIPDDQGNKGDHVDIAWGSQKARNFCAAAGIPCTLLHRDNPKLPAIQTALYKTGLFPPLVQHALCPTAPSLVRVAALSVLELLMSANEQIQGVFSRHVVDTPGSHPVPAVLSVIRTAVEPSSGGGGGSGSLALRLSATNMLGAYLRFNPEGQLGIAATFKSPRLAGSPEAGDLSAGSMIIERAFDLSGIHRDPFGVWFPTLILTHIIRENDQCKEIALRHRHVLEDGDEDDVTLLARILLQLTEAVRDPRHVHTATAYLMLIATWIYGFPAAVTVLLAEGSNVQFLTELINQNSTADARIQGCAALVLALAILFHDHSAGPFSRRSLEDIVKNRIGVDVFAARMVRTRNVLSAFLATEGELDSNANPGDTLHDRYFAELFLESYDKVLRIFLSPANRTGRSSTYGRARTTEASVETGGGSTPRSIRASQLEEPASLRTERLEELESFCTPLQDVQPPAQQPSSAHEKNVESKCAYLVGENARLQATISAYAAQLAQIEQDNEELLVTLGTYEAELKQLRRHLTDAGADVGAGAGGGGGALESAAEMTSGADTGDERGPSHLTDFVRPSPIPTPALAVEESSPQTETTAEPIPIPPAASEPLANALTDAAPQDVQSPSKQTLQERLGALVHAASPSTATHNV